MLSGMIAWTLVETISWGHGKYQNYKNPIELGREMFLVRQEENPFEKHDTLFAKILEVKDGYVLYEEKIRERKDTTPAHVGYLRDFTPVNRD